MFELSPFLLSSFSHYCFLQKTEKTEFLSFFYKYCMHVLTAPLLAAHDRNSKGGLAIKEFVDIFSFRLMEC